MIETTYIDYDIYLKPRELKAARKAMALHASKHPTCVWCGSDIDPWVHHIIPVHDDPTLAADPANMITLCGPNGCHAHFCLGHLGDYKLSNPFVKEACVSRWTGY